MRDPSGGSAHKLTAQTQSELRSALAAQLASGRFGERLSSVETLAHIMRLSRWTQQQIAEALGLQQGAVSQFATGKRRAPVELATLPDDPPE